MNRLVLPLLLVIVFVVTSAAPLLADAGNSAYDKARRQYQSLIQSTEKQKKRHHWEKAIRSFRNVYKGYPGHRRQTDALYMVGKCQMRLYEISRRGQDARDSIESFDLLATRFSESNLADDALYHGGELARELGDYPGAFLRFQRVVADYPSGDMLARAKNQLELLDRIQPVAPAPRAAVTTGKPATSAAPPRTVAPPPSVESGVRVQKVRYWSNPSYTRIVLDLSGKAEFVANVLGSSSDGSQGYRLYVDLKKTRPGTGVPGEIKISDGLLKQVRTGYSGGKTRVVLDLNSLGDYKVFALGNPNRVVIDIRGDQTATAKSSPPASRGSGPASGQDDIARLLKPGASPTKPLPGNTKKNGIPVIVVDAGHGGKDPGAIGKGGTYEKTVVLALAKKLRKELKKIMKCEVILTRDRDVFLDLAERTAIANKHSADIFISIHANATRSRKPYGIETYFLNLAKEDKAAELAAKENGTSLQEVSNLEAILFDLMANSKINESSRLAAAVQLSLVKNMKKKYSYIKDLGVRQGPFYVLLGATMPSVLVETAFISNPREEKRLMNATYQTRAAAAIAAGIKAYAQQMNLVASR